MKSWEEEPPLFPLLKLSAGSGGLEEEEGEVLSFASPSLGNFKVVREKHLRTVSLKRVANLYDFGFESLPRSCFPTNQAHQLRGGQEV